MKKAYTKKLNRFLAANFLAVLIGFPLSFFNAPALAKEKSPISDHSFSAVSMVLNPNANDQKDEDPKLNVRDNAFLQSFRAGQGNYENETDNKLAVASVKKSVIVTAYSSTPDQTDDTPFITANGTYVHDGVIAANFLPFGAKVRFPEFSGGKVYTVHDRMAKRFSYKMDIWMETRGAALEFGVKKLTVEILE